MVWRNDTSDGIHSTAGDYALVLAQERIVVEAQVAITRLLHDAGLKQEDLASLLGVSERRVDEMFGDNACDLTLRTLAHIFHVLGSRCRIVSAEELEAGKSSYVDARVSVKTQVEDV